MNNLRAPTSMALLVAASKTLVWRRWLLVAISCVLFTALIELGHNHANHKTTNASECVICQHAIALDKVLLTGIASLTIVLISAIDLVTHRISRGIQPTRCTQIRAPPIFTP